MRIKLDTLLRQAAKHNGPLYDVIASLGNSLGLSVHPSLMQKATLARIDGLPLFLPKYGPLTGVEPLEDFLRTGPSCAQFIDAIEQFNQWEPWMLVTLPLGLNKVPFAEKLRSNGIPFTFCTNLSLIALYRDKGAKIYNLDHSDVAGTCVDTSKPFDLHRVKLGFAWAAPAFVR